MQKHDEGAVAEAAGFELNERSWTLAQDMGMVKIKHYAGLEREGVEGVYVALLSDYLDAPYEEVGSWPTMAEAVEAGLRALEGMRPRAWRHARWVAELEADVEPLVMRRLLNDYLAELGMEGALHALAGKANAARAQAKAAAQAGPWD